MPARHRLDRYDEHGQDTWKSPDEESFAAEMGQPSEVPRYEWGPAETHRHSPEQLKQMQSIRPAVLAQTPVRCNKCDRMAVPFEDVIVLVDGVWMHDECHELDG